MKKIKVAVFVSGGGTNLQALIDAEKSGIIKSAEISLVVSSNKDAYSLIRAKNANIKTVILEKKDEAFEDNLVAILKENNVDLIVLAGFLHILSGAFTAKYSNRIINVHPSLIPKYCGKGFYGIKVHEAVINAHEKETGATVHFVNEVPDGGEIISQGKVRVMEDDTAQVLQKRVMEEAEWVLLPKAVEKTAKQLLKEKNK